MRYVSDLHIGRVNPRHLRFDLDIGPKKHELPGFVRERLVDSTDVQAQLANVEPPYAGYKRTLEALERYLDLARQDDAEQLPVPHKAIGPESLYEGVPRLTRFLRLVGDLPPDTVLPGSSKVYGRALFEAVKRFQERHGMTSSGQLDAQTVRAMNVPLSSRVEQIRLVLERWRWIPYQFAIPPVVVNIPKFRLRAFEGGDKVALRMKVIVGKAYLHQTPCVRTRHAVCSVPPILERAEKHPTFRNRSGHRTRPELYCEEELRDHHSSRQPGNLGRGQRGGLSPVGCWNVNGATKAWPVERSWAHKIHVSQ
jgi:murein L,D-transpeptidase YcbB/YkuD